MASPILSQPVVTLGCPTLGVIIVILVVQRWWTKGGMTKRGGKNDGGNTGWTELVPFVMALCLGMVAVLASGGWSALGVLTRLGLWGGNAAGYGYLVYVVGGSSPTVTRPHPVILTAGGYAIYAIWVATVVGRMVWSKKIARMQTWLGLFAGVFLGMSAGVAGVAAVPIASTVNILGAWFRGTL